MKWLGLEPLGSQSEELLPWDFWEWGENFVWIKEKWGEMGYNVKKWEGMD